MSRALIVIPARYASSRLPGKPLLADTGKTLIQHTFETASAVPNADVIIATDDQRIKEAVEGFGGVAIMTAPDHPSGTDRIAEAVTTHSSSADVIINLQGDEPEVEQAVITDLIETHRNAQTGHRPAFVSTVVCPFKNQGDAENPHAVKAVLSQARDGIRDALYFSRSLIPYPRVPDQQDAGPFLHLGLYAYSPDSLQQYTNLTPTPLERTEGLEQLRVLEHGHRIAVTITDQAAPGIDTPEDYQAFVDRYSRR